MECPHVPVIKYGDFGQRVAESIGDKRFPYNGSIEVTSRCNLHCSHCYINPVSGAPKESELNLAETTRILDEIADEGCLWLLLTGGEPFIRPDFLDIYTYAKKKGFIITLFSNGTLITPRIADYLAEWPPFVVEISLYGCTQETYEKFTGVPGSFANCIRGIELLLERKISLTLKTVVTTVNRHEISGIKEYAEKHQVDFRFDPILNLCLDGNPKPADYRIPATDVVAMDQADKERMQNWHRFSKNFKGAPQDPDYLYQCGAGARTFHIDSHGHLSVCMMARVPYYDLRVASFHQGWNDFMTKVRAQKWIRETPCKTCDLISICGQCPGMAYLETGDPEKKVEYLCEIAHLRKESLCL